VEAHVVEATNGNDALAATLEHEFALAILDVNMPGMDGYELASILRDSGGTRNLPIIFMTATYGQEQQVFEGYEAGAVDYIIKPYNPTVLLSKVSVFLELHRNRAALVEKVEALTASEERFRSLVMTVPDIVYRIDPDGRFTFLNDAIMGLGYTVDELVGEHFSRLIHPADVDDVSRAAVLSRFAGKETGPEAAPKLFDERRTGARRTANLEVRLVPRRGGETVPALIHAVGDDYLVVEISSSGLYSGPFGKSKPVFLGTVGVIRDITTRKREEEELQRYREHLQELVDEQAGHITHLNAVLRGIRDVNQLIVREKVREPLIRQGCDLLTQGRGFHGAWIALTDRLPQHLDVAQSGFDEAAFRELGKCFLDGDLPPCCRRGDDQGVIVVHSDPERDCPDCPLAGIYGGTTSICASITHEGRRYGWMGAAVPRQFGDDPEEASLMEEIAGDIGFALYGMEREADRQQAADCQSLHARALGILNRPNRWQDLLRDLLAEIKAFTGFDAVGIRLQEGSDYPYHVHDGFSEDFLGRERYLCSHDESGNVIRDADGDPILECMCGNVIRCRTDPSRPFFTENGSFWTNSTTKLLAGTSQDDRGGRTRNQCHRAGYETVALIPVRSKGEVVGLLQLNNRRPDSLTLAMTRFFEEMGNSIGIAYLRQQQERRHARYARIVAAAQDAMALVSKDYTYLEANPTYASLVGRSNESLVGESVEHVLGGKMAGAIEAKLERCFGGEVVSFETPFKLPTGRPATLAAVYAPCHLPDGSVDAVAVCIRDVTESKEAEHELQQHREHLEELVAERTEKLEAAGEELRKHAASLESFTKMSVGREKRMIQLKKEINGLLEEGGQPPKYRIAE